MTHPRSVVRLEDSLRRPLPDRFWAKVEVGDCWQWTAARNRGGYGVFRIGGRQEGRTFLAHRLAFTSLVEVPPQPLDHLCKNPACVNPDHLEPVSRRENVRRGAAGAVSGRRQKSKTHCPHGHEYTPENTRIGHGARHCLECGRKRARERYRRKNNLPPEKYRV